MDKTIELLQTMTKLCSNIVNKLEALELRIVVLPRASSHKIRGLDNIPRYSFREKLLLPGSMVLYAIKIFPENPGIRLYRSYNDSQILLITRLST